MIFSQNSLLVRSEGTRVAHSIYFLSVTSSLCIVCWPDISTVKHQVVNMCHVVQRLYIDEYKGNANI